MFFRRRPGTDFQPEWLIAGLGNPGMQYANTRHNVGHAAARALAKEHDISLSQRRFRALYGTGYVQERPVVIALPMTYMNLSGDAVAPILKHFNLKPDRLCVVCDEMALPVGRIRLRLKGSAGGQKGLANIIERLRTEEFLRLRIGIDRPNPGFEVEYVLTNFSREELPIIKDALERARLAIETMIAYGPERAMDEFNRGAE